MEIIYQISNGWSSIKRLLKQAGIHESDQRVSLRDTLLDASLIFWEQIEFLSSLSNSVVVSKEGVEGSKLCPSSAELGVCVSKEPADINPNEGNSKERERLDLANRVFKLLKRSGVVSQPVLGILAMA